MGCGSSSRQKPTVIMILGGPGSGKGTVCAKLKENHNMIHLSTGELLREEVDKKGPEANKIAEIQSSGKLVPSEILVKIVQKKLLDNPKGLFLLDGFPRNEENVKVWNKIIGSSADASVILFYDCSDETMTSRLLERGQSSGRPDDNEETIKVRLSTFREQTMKVVELKKKEGKLVVIDAEKSPEEVYNQTIEELGKRNLLSRD